MKALLNVILTSGVLSAPPAQAQDTFIVVRAPDSVQTPAPLLEPWPRFTADLSVVGDTSQGRQRPKAIEYSEAYGVRLEIHKYASYATLPLFVTEYFVGQSIINDSTRGNTLRTAHSFVAGAIGGLFVVNTVTGVWNLWESRKDPAGRTRRWIHAGLMIAADAGFVMTASSTPRGFNRINTTPGDPTTHKTLAITSMAVALASYGMMLLWKE